MNLKKFFSKQLEQTSERRVYEAIVAQARQPWFYADLGVPDTVEARYDMIVLHSFVVMDRLSGASGKSDDFAQRLFDELFKDMDRSLREMGVGDISVGKKVRKMAEMFYGRAEAYRSAFGFAESDGCEALKTALARNVYAAEVPPAVLDQLAQYALHLRAGLAASDVEPILAGDIIFPDPGSLNNATAN